VEPSAGQKMLASVYDVPQTGQTLGMAQCAGAGSRGRARAVKRKMRGNAA